MCTIYRMNSKYLTSSTHISTKQPCALFVPTVKDSRICSVCRHLLHEHSDISSAINSINRAAVVTASTIANSRDHPTRIRPIPYVYNSRSSDSGYRSGRSFDERFRRVSTIEPRKSTQLSQSANSAFSQYKRTNGDDGGSCNDSSASPASSVSVSSSSDPDDNISPPSLFVSNNFSSKYLYE